MADLDQGIVKSFLTDNPEFTKNWFIKNIDVVTLQEWMEDDELQEQSSTEMKSNYSLMQLNSMTMANTRFQDFIQGKKKNSTTVNKKIKDLESLSEMDRFMELIRDVANELDVDILCHKILSNVIILTKSDKGSLFLMQGSRDKKYLVSKLFDVTKDATLEDCLHEDDNQIRIPLGKGIAGTVANSKHSINIKDAYKDSRFNKEIDDKTGYRTKSILCLPILNYEGECIGVAQIINKTAEGSEFFTPKDEEVFRNYLTFCGIGLTNAQLFEMSVEEYKRNQLLLNLAKGIFAEQQNLDKLVEKIMLEAQELLLVQRCNVFLMEEGIEGGKEAIMNSQRSTDGIQPVSSRKSTTVDPSKIFFNKVFQLNVAPDGSRGSVTNLAINDISKSKIHSIAQKVAYSCEIVNYNSSEGTTDPDMAKLSDYDGSAIHGLLGIPILDENKICLGVVQLINKHNGKPFTDPDINILEAFSIFCGLGIHNCIMYESACLLMAKQTVALEVLSYHATASLEDTEELMKTVVKDPKKIELYEYCFSDLDLSELQTAACTVDLFVSSGVVKTYRVPLLELNRWVLSVKKNYRPVIYHNWRHGFNVCQSMYCMCFTSGMKKYFSDLEIFSMLVACLSHDLDHRGTNNTFQNKVQSPIAQLYSSSTMEHHHFDQCVMILNSEGNNIFKNLTSKEYREALKAVELAILATDLALYFKKKDIFKAMVDKGKADWTDPEKRQLLRGMMMTACDLAGICKPWELQKKIAELVSSEFFEQGDMERNILKEEPIAMMDRKKKEELPKMQCGFIDFVCLPLYKVLVQVHQKLQPLLDGVENNRCEWQKLADIQAKAEKSRKSSVSKSDNDSAKKVVRLEDKKDDQSKRKKSNPASSVSLKSSTKSIKIKEDQTKSDTSKVKKSSAKSTSSSATPSAKNMKPRGSFSSKSKK